MERGIFVKKAGAFKQDPETIVLEVSEAISATLNELHPDSERISREAVHSENTSLKMTAISAPKANAVRSSHRNASPVREQTTHELHPVSLRPKVLLCPI